MKRGSREAGTFSSREAIARERRLRIRDACCVHAADAAFDGVQVTVAAVSIARGAPDCEVLSRVEKGRADAGEEAAPAGNQGRAPFHYRLSALAEAARSNSSPHSVHAPRDGTSS